MCRLLVVVFVSVLNIFNKMTTQKIIAYFQASKDTFWRWSSDGTVVEWKDGSTIVYRDDFIPIFKQLKPIGLPPFAAILLVLSATKRRIESEKIELLRQCLEQSFSPNMDELAQEWYTKMGRMIRILNYISDLPEALRKGEARTLLLYEIFCHNKALLSSELFSEFLARPS